MKARLEERLRSLRAEFEEGRKSLADLETRESSLRATLLRISGAIQVLEEELGKEMPSAEAAGERRPLEVTAASPAA